MKIKKLPWVQTSKRLLNKGQKTERITETWEAKTIFGKFIVYSAIGGGFFYKGAGYVGVENFQNLCGVVKSPPRCDSIQDGKDICQKAFEKDVSKCLTEG